MGQTKTKIESFSKEIIARLKGDEAGVKAARISRKCLAAIDSQLAALNAKRVDTEAALEDARERVDNAKFPKEVPISGENYIKAITEGVEKANKFVNELEEIDETIEYYTEFLKTF